MVEEGRRQLAAAVAGDPDSIKDVISTLAQVKAAAEVIDPRGQQDGIACFTQLYYEITCGVQAAVDAHRFTAGDFIVHLDLAFARRYLAALRALTSDNAHPAGCWQALFAARSEPNVPTLNYAMAGVNAHVNYDLAMALLDTWEQNPAPQSTDPNDAALREAQHTDYNTINDIFDENMGRLRGEFHSPLGALGPGSLLDKFGNFMGDLLVRDTRDLAWNAAVGVWRFHDTVDYQARRDIEERQLDQWATRLGEWIIAVPVIPA